MASFEDADDYNDEDYVLNDLGDNSDSENGSNKENVSKQPKTESESTQRSIQGSNSQSVHKKIHSNQNQNLKGMRETHFLFFIHQIYQFSF